MNIRSLLGIALLSLFLGGCVTGTRSIALTAPDYNNDATASGAIFIGETRDGRQFEQKPKQASTPSVKGDLATVDAQKRATRIGRQRNTYGKALGDIQLPKGSTIQSTMKALLVEGLESRGYDVTDDAGAPHRIDVDIEKFWAWSRPGMWSIGFDSEVACTVHWSGAQVDQDIHVSGSAVNKGQVASDANWQLTYDRAFTDFLNNLDSTLDSKGL